jgi:hypothetical protein
MKHQKGSIILIVLAIAALIGAGTIIYLKNPNLIRPKQQACTLEAKVCPDGSSVGRTGSNCEFAPCPSTQPTISPDETSGWKTYGNEEYGFELKYPSAWTKLSPTLTGTGSFQEFSDPNHIFTLTISKRANYNNETGKPFNSLKEYVNMPYGGRILKVDGQEGIQYLPRAGSENINSVDFFSKDLKNIYAIDLETTSKTDAQIQEGQKLFGQILSTFKFFDQPASSSGSVEGKFCGGIAGVACPGGYKCKLDGSYPDAGGTCIKY